MYWMIKKLLFAKLKVKLIFFFHISKFSFRVYKNQFLKLMNMFD